MPRETEDPSSEDTHELTEWLSKARHGDQTAAESAFRAIQSNLRAMAALHLRKQPPSAELQTTELVNELYLKLFGSLGSGWKDRGHFFRVAARAMRSILVDHARSRGREKRGGGVGSVSLDSVVLPDPRSRQSIIELDETLAEMQEIDPRFVQLIELRFVAGLPIQDVAKAMSMSVRSTERELRLARSFLTDRLDT